MRAFRIFAAASVVCAFLLTACSSESDPEQVPAAEETTRTTSVPFVRPLTPRVEALISELTGAAATETSGDIEADEVRFARALALVPSSDDICDVLDDSFSREGSGPLSDGVPTYGPRRAGRELADEALRCAVRFSYDGGDWAVTVGEGNGFFAPDGQASVEVTLEAP